MRKNVRFRLRLFGSVLLLMGLFALDFHIMQGIRLGTNLYLISGMLLSLSGVFIMSVSNGTQLSLYPSFKRRE